MNRYNASTHVAATRSRSKILSASRTPLQTLTPTSSPPRWELAHVFLIPFQVSVPLTLQSSCASFWTWHRLILRVFFCDLFVSQTDLMDSLALPIFDLHKNEIMLHECLCYVIEIYSCSFPLLKSIPVCERITLCHTTDRHLSCFQFGHIMKSIVI